MNNSIWDTYSKPRRMLPIFVAISLVGVSLIIWAGTGLVLNLLSTGKQVSQPSIVSQIDAAFPQQAKEQEAVTASSPLPLPGILSTVFGQNDEGENDIDEALAVSNDEEQGRVLPHFVQTVNYITGSRPVKISLPDSVEPLALATAMFSRSDIPGVAGEWRVSPWWMPGWIPESADCGDGHTIIAGHVSWYKRAGPFQYLGAIKQGQVIECVSGANTLIRYEVTEIARVDYTDVATYWGRVQNHSRNDDNNGDGEITSPIPTLTLYTCTPEIDGIIIVRAIQTGETIENDQITQINN